MGNNSVYDETQTVVKIKNVNKVLHFSDGTMEADSDDEYDNQEKTTYEGNINPSDMTWFPWLKYKTSLAGSTALSAADYAGEFLASIFGITTPKYYFELEEYKRRKLEAEQRLENAKGWSRPSDAISVTVPLKELPTQLNSMENNK